MEHKLNAHQCPLDNKQENNLNINKDSIVNVIREEITRSHFMQRSCTQVLTVQDYYNAHFIG